jgi:hypothetical protein
VDVAIAFDVPPLTEVRERHAHCTVARFLQTPFLKGWCMLLAVLSTCADDCCI